MYLSLKQISELNRHTGAPIKQGPYKDTIRRKKHSARKRVKYALKKGYLAKGPCDVCGDMAVEAHHPNYDVPLEVLWLCRDHHLDLHWYEKHPTTPRPA